MLSLFNSEVTFVKFLTDNFSTILDHLGTFAFAISGIRLASAKKFDWFGAYVVGFVTAIGGGTTRDIFLGVTPFWMLQPSYLIVTGIALVVFMFFNKRLTKLHKTLFLFDAVGLGLFVVVGIQKSIDADFPFWVAIIMGTITGSIGGVIRDVLINEMPLIFRRDIYASACIIGGIAFFICYNFNLSLLVTDIVTASTVILIRLLAVRFKIQIPTLKSQNN